MDELCGEFDIYEDINKNSDVSGSFKISGNVLTLTVGGKSMKGELSADTNTLTFADAGIDNVESAVILSKEFSRAAN